MRNQQIPNHLKHLDRWAQKIEVIKNYKFTLAFENSNTKDYVTEKFFQCFDAGSIPGFKSKLRLLILVVYLGAPNIDDFSPSDHSVIKVSDFK